ncbi:hypothetical protein N9N28_16275 [Rubripirellula amarantea]|nr:hypothetical protein [Rubripirellula amarantea]
MKYPPEVIEFLKQRGQANRVVINSAVFNAGFLVGGKYFDYQVVTPESHPRLFEWRDRFMSFCKS